MYGPSAAHLATAKNAKQRAFILANYVPPAPAPLPPPPPPPPPQPIQSPLEIETSNRSRLASSSRAKRRRAKAQRGKRQLTTGLNTGAVTGSQGGVSF